MPAAMNKARQAVPVVPDGASAACPGPRSGASRGLSRPEPPRMRPRIALPGVRGDEKRGAAFGAAGPRGETGT